MVPHPMFSFQMRVGDVDGSWAHAQWHIVVFVPRFPGPAMAACPRPLLHLCRLLCPYAVAAVPVVAGGVADVGAVAGSGAVAHPERLPFSGGRAGRGPACRPVGACPSGC